jgi:HEXXH motif-containing protein
VTSSVQNGEAALSSPVLYSFEPSADRVRFLDQRMRLCLKESLNHVFDQSWELLNLSKGRLDKFLSQLEGKPVSPLAFSLYCDLVIAIESDDLSEASQLIEELTALPEHPGGPKILELADPKRDSTARRYARFVDTDPQMPFEIFAPSREAAQSCRKQIQSAFALMDAGDPELASEIRALLREIVLAAGTVETGAYTFDGASSFMLWGAIIINANRSDGELGMAQMLAHESAHNLLFGLCTDEPLLNNSPDERHASPLRPDPRPLEGIYHATFVSARMFRAVKTLLESGTLPPELETKARQDLETDARCFSQGMEIITRHGKLTEIGRAIIQGADDYMDSAR